MAKLLSRVPVEELSNVDMNQIFLPSRESKMYQANQMIYDDAPWLSSLVTAHIKRSKHYVHEDLNNEIARILGAKSLREVLSASQVSLFAYCIPLLFQFVIIILPSHTSNNISFYFIILSISTRMVW